MPAMPTFRVHLDTTLSLSVTVDAEDEDEAADKAWQIAEEFAKSLRPHGDERLTSVDATFDGITAYEITRAPSERRQRG